MTFIVNLYGGPGTGKSTTATGTFSLLKLHGVRCEYVSEYAKDLTWEKSNNKLSNQIAMFGKQYHRVWRLLDQVDVIVTDSPLLLGCVYGASDALEDLIINSYESMDNIDVYLKRIKEYDPVGRNQSYEEALEIDNKLKALMITKGINCIQLKADYNAINKLTDIILHRLGKEQTIKIGV